MLDDLTPAEKLWLWRRRKRLTQEAAARLFGVGRSRYSRAELRGVLGPIKITPIAPKAPDLLPLARRRAKLPLADLARTLGVTRVTVLKWERQGAERLVGFWRSRGFTFD